MLNHAALWSIKRIPKSGLEVHSPLAVDVIGLECFPEHLGDTLIGVRVEGTRVKPRRSVLSFATWYRP